MNRPFNTIECLLLAILFTLLIPTSSTAGHRDLTASYTTPMTGQAGTEATVTVIGNRLQNIEDILFYDKGIKFLGHEPVSEKRRLSHDSIDPVEPGKAAKLKFSISPDCRIGCHYYRIRTDEILSELLSLWVTPYPVVEEANIAWDTDKKTNGTFETAQPIKLNTTVYGYALSYDLQDHDFFKVDLEKGQRLTIEMWADCLNFHGTHDPAVAVYTPDKEVVAYSDNTDLTLRDPWLSFLAPEKGTYYIDIHKSLEAEHQPSHYIAHITSETRPALTFPLGGQAGKKVKLKLLDHKGMNQETELQLPDQVGEFEAAMIEHRFSKAVVPNYLKVADFPDVTEDGKSHFTPETAQVYKGDLPVAFNGIIKDQAKTDWYRFSAKQGERYRIYTYAAQLGSPLDGFITIKPAEGTQSRINLEVDDSVFVNHDLVAYKNGADSMKLDPVTIFEPDVDGDYLLGIRDSQYLGGPLHAYRIEIQPFTDRAFFNVQRDYRELRWKRETFAVHQNNSMERPMFIFSPPGNRYKGPVEITAENLPPGVTLNPTTIRVDQRTFQMSFTADKNAKPWAGFIDLKMRPLEPADNMKGGYIFHTVADGGRGGYGDSFYLMRKCPLTIMKAAPLAAKVVKPKVSLMRNANLELDVEIERRGYEGDVRVYCYWTPQGVTASAPTIVPAGQNKTTVNLSADKGAPLGDFPMIVSVQEDIQGNVKDELGVMHNGVGNGFHYVASPPVQVTVSDPYFEATFAKSAIERQTTGEITINMKYLRDLPSKAVAKLTDLPKGVESLKDISFDPGTESITFRVKVTTDCLVGQYKDINCQVTLKDNGQTISQTIKGGMLRVDEERK